MVPIALGSTSESHIGVGSCILLSSEQDPSVARKKAKKQDLTS